MTFWYELRINADNATLSNIESELEDNAAVLALTYLPCENTNELLEPLPGEHPIWDGNILTALFANEEALFLTIKNLQITPENFEINVIANENWVEKCRSTFKPKKFGKNIWLYPSWCEPPAENAITICLDPGLAFGTGEHETTTLCLEWLDKCFTPGQSVLDFGCGTGILGIAAAKMGARRVVGVDIDPQAIVATDENSKKNHVDTIVSAVHTDDFKTYEKFDLIIANILARPLINLKQLFLNHLNDNGFIVVSGILESQREWIEKNYSPELAYKSHSSLNNWTCLAFVRK